MIEYSYLLNLSITLIANTKSEYLEKLVLMAFLPKPGEIIEDAELYELSGDEDDRLRHEYEYITFLLKFYGMRAII